MRRVPLLLVMWFATCNVAYPQESAPPYEVKGQELKKLMGEDKSLSAMLKVDSVDFDYSEQKVIEGQPHRVGYYKAKMTMLKDACVIVINDLGYMFTSDMSLCPFGGAAGWQKGSSPNYPLKVTRKQTDQGWRIVGQQRLQRFGTD